MILTFNPCCFYVFKVHRSMVTVGLMPWKISILRIITACFLSPAIIYISLKTDGPNYQMKPNCYEVPPIALSFKTNSAKLLSWIVLTVYKTQNWWPFCVCREAGLGCNGSACILLTSNAWEYFISTVGGNESVVELLVFK